MSVQNKKLFSVLLSGLLISVLFFSSEAKAGTIEVTFEDGLISVSAEEATVREVMAAVKGKTKVDYRFNGTPPTAKETVYFGEMDLENGLLEILSIYALDNYLISEGETAGDVESIEIYCESASDTAPSAKSDSADSYNYPSDTPVTYEDGSLTVNIKNESILGVISDLETETGLIFNVTGDIPEEEISVKVSKSTLKKGLESVFRKMPLKNYKFNYDPYADTESVIESVDLVFSGGEEEEATPEEEESTTASTKKIEDASDKYAPPGSETTTTSDTGKRIYSTEIKDASADYRPPTSTGSGSTIYGAETKSTSSGPGIYGTERRTSSGAGPGIYGTESRSSSGAGPGIYGTESRSSSSSGPGMYGSESR